MSAAATQTAAFDTAEFLARLGEIIANPGANLTAAFFLLAVVGIVGLMIVVVVALRALSLQDGVSKASPAADESAPESGDLCAGEVSEGSTGGRAHRVMTAVVVLGLLVLGAAVVVFYSGSQRICYEACHTDVVVTVTDGAVVPAHTGAPCVACHEPPGGLRLAFLGPRFGHVLGHSAGVAYPYPPAGSRGCLSCHAEILDGVRVSSDIPVRMSHAEPVASGLGCPDCHATGHDESADRPAGRMNRCLSCHDAQTASSECSTCHTTDPGVMRREAGSGRILGRVSASPRVDCGGCHDLAPCDACHGIRMPHTKEFEEVGHAMAAAFEKKELCFEQCHEEADCGACHGNFASHGPGFKESHGTGRSFASPCSCHAPADNPARPFCPVCHTDR